TNNSYTVTQNGDYYVRVTNSNSCSANSDTVTILSIGISNIEQNGMRLYPQPAEGVFTIEASFAINQPRISIIDMKGARVAYEVLASDAHHIRLKISEAVPGVYFLSIENDEQVYHQKILMK